MLSSNFNENTTPLSPTRIKERTLSYYFNLHNNEDVLPPWAADSNKHHIKSTSSNSCSTTTTKRARDGHTKHESSSEKMQWRPLLVDDSEGGVPLSWLSALFSGRKRKQKPRSNRAGGDGKCEPFPATSLDWEAPRASSWEQLSSWEKPSSSPWDLPSAQPHRASDANMQELHPTMQELHPTIAMQAAPEIDPPVMKKERSKGGQLQWMKSLLAIKWAIKLRKKLTKKRAAEQGRGDGEDDDRESTMSAASSSARRSDYSQNALHSGQIKSGQDCFFHSQRELGATWSAHYSPLLQGYTSLKHNNKVRPSYNNRGESGLLRFYLTPTRGIKIGSKRQRSHHPLISEV